MATKDYNALAAEMMGYKAIPPELEHGLLVAITDDYRMWWNPLQDRNQAYLLLKRAEELGLAEKVEEIIYLFAWKNLTIEEIRWRILTCPTNIIVKACVDVWEEKRLTEEHWRYD